eukprot:gnl/MRDRNA2_/MRDRNA2_119893_c0_seq1.p1 gnl/MRDRNA2_/MRDRNA2_119893_c0~~gnl/MRDRNA2_/MRDRNA2_119893_c0_seq1.p1  ORF type:complete len:362 (+),score=90.61 gnl/MRDRNA2_/MRDRNA2_119893_c0_seq1:70-1155(+)
MRSFIVGAILLSANVFGKPLEFSKVQNPVSPERQAELTKEVKAKVRGIALPLLTFYQEDGSVDHAAMAAYVKKMIADGLVEGKGFILTAASGGDFPVLSIAERKAIAKTVQDATEGKVPIFLSVQETHLETAIELAQYAEEIGCYGIQVSVPYYWTTTDGDAVPWFEAIHNATKKVIIIMYNTPWENYDAPVEVLHELAKLERVRVLKFFTSRDPMTFRWAQTMTQLRDEYAIIDNTLNPVQHHMLGGTAFITHLASVWPQHELKMYELLEEGNYTGALKMWEGGMLPWYDLRIKMGEYTSGESPPVKAAMKLAGRIPAEGPYRLPSRPLTDDLREELRQLLLKIGVPGVQQYADNQQIQI